jgi:hypothetical protein
VLFSATIPTLPYRLRRDKKPERKKKKPYPVSRIGTYSPPQGMASTQPAIGLWRTTHPLTQSPLAATGSCYLCRLADQDVCEVWCLFLPAACADIKFEVGSLTHSSLFALHNAMCSVLQYVRISCLVPTKTALIPSPGTLSLGLS